MATVAKRRFIRADGPDKVTGSGRYTADLTLTGMLHAKFKFAGVTHGRITRLDTSKAEALPGVLRRGRPTRTSPTCSTATSSRTATCSARSTSASRATSSPPSPRLTPEIAAAGDRSDRGRLRAAAGRQRPRGGARRRRAARARRLGRPTATPTAWCATATTPPTRRSSRATSSRACATPTSSSRAATWPTARHADADRAARDRRAVVGRPRHRSGPRRRCRSRPAAASWTRSSCPRARCASSCRILGGGFGGKCGFHYEAHIAVLARKSRAPGEARVHAPRGVHRSRQAPRGHDRRDRERREEGRHDHRAAAAS